jgi:hypothetical protein
MVENRGKVVSAPQCVQRTLQIVSVCAISNMAASTSPTGNVRITARALVAQDIGFASAHADDQATAAVDIGDVRCGMIGRPTLFTSMSTVGKREVVDRAPSFASVVAMVSRFRP